MAKKYEYVKVNKKRLQWIYNNLYMLIYWQVFSSKEIKNILQYLEDYGISFDKE